MVLSNVQHEEARVSLFATSNLRLAHLQIYDM